MLMFKFNRNSNNWIVYTQENPGLGVINMSEDGMFVVEPNRATFKKKFPTLEKAKSVFHLMANAEKLCKGIVEKLAEGMTAQFQYFLERMLSKEEMELVQILIDTLEESKPSNEQKDEST